MNNIQPLKSTWKLQDGYTDGFKERVNSESWVNNCKGYPATEKEDKVDILCPRAERKNI